METILPSDILLLTIDYLDSPSMMECRQVCKSWLDVVDQNRLLWNSFHIPKDGKDFKLGMLELFTSRSATGLVSFSVGKMIGEPKIKEGMGKSAKATARRNASEFVSRVGQVLLKSSSTLVSYSCPQHELGTRVLESLYNSSKFKSFHHYTVDDDATEIIKVKHRGSLPSLNQDQNLGAGSKSLSSESGMRRIIVGYCQVVGFEKIPILETSRSNLVHLQMSIKELSNKVITLPSLKILELTGWESKSILSSNLSFPTLKVLTISGSKGWSIPDNLSSTLEVVWLLRAMSHVIDGVEHISKCSLLMKGADALVQNYPRLRSFRIDSTVDFNEKGLVKMLEARKENVQTGYKVGGVKMLAIEKLILDVGKIKDAKNLKKLKGLVELVDCRDAPSSITID